MLRGLSGLITQGTPGSDGADSIATTQFCLIARLAQNGFLRNGAGF